LQDVFSVPVMSPIIRGHHRNKLTVAFPSALITVKTPA